MKTEKLLKDINGLLKKHERFLNENPEFFFAIEDRLLKAVGRRGDDEDEYEEEGDENYKDDFDQDEDGGGLGLFDDEQESDYDDEEPEYEDEDEAYARGSQPEEDEDEADQWLRENDPNRAQETEEIPVEVDEPSYEDEQPEMDLEDKPAAQQAPAKSERKSSGRMTDWKPRDKYEAQHQALIEQHMKDGYSHREAERLANAHQAPTNFYDALRSSTRPSEPSPKMLERMKSLAHEWLRNADRKTSESAEADVNPQKYASAKTLAAHDAAHKDFKAAHDEYLNSDEVKGLTGRARHQAIQAWKQKWHEANPEHRDAAIQAAGSGKALSDANEARKKRLQEGQASILTAGFSSGEDNPMEGEFSSGAAGEQVGHQAAAQSVGAEKEGEDGGFQTNVKKDPNLVFAEQNPDYIKHLKTKLASKMAPEQAQRLSAVDSFKKKGPQ